MNTCKCVICSEFECDNHTIFPITIQELKEIYKLLEYQYIPYENEQGHAVVNKIMNIIKESE